MRPSFARWIHAIALGLLCWGCDDTGGDRARLDAGRDSGGDALAVDAAAHDAARPRRDAQAPDADAAIRPPDADIPPEPDAALPAPDARPPAPDAAPPEPDAVLPEPDAALPEPDAMLPEPDAALPDLDAAPPEPDAAPPEPDAAPPEPDAAPPEPDAALPQPDAAPGCLADLTPPWTRRIVRAGGTVVFNELMVDPPGDGGPEWVELYNQMAVDMDLSGWTLEGAIHFRFPPGTILRGGEWLVVASDPARLAAATGLADIHGPYAGRLARRGERVDLRSNGGRLMDTVEYEDAPPWPVPPAGSGRSLAKVDPDSASARAENWTVSQIGGTPGADNFPDPGAPVPVTTLVPLDATWRYEDTDQPHGPAWRARGYDDGGWDEGRAVFYAGEPPGGSVAVRVTADSYFALYTGGADGEGLRLIGRDTLGDWQSAEDFDVPLAPADHLYIAAWEAPGDSGTPQMLIAQARLPDGTTLGTHVTTFEVVLGPAGANPGAGLAAPPPFVADVRWVVEQANQAGAWAAPAAQLGPAESPWSGALAGAFGPAASYLWLDTFDGNSITDVRNTYALFRSRAPVLPAAGDAEVLAGQVTTYFRTTFDFDGDPTATRLELEVLADDAALVWLNGVEVHRQNLPDGEVHHGTLALAPVDGPPAARTVAIPSDALVAGANVLAVEVHQAALDDPDLRFAAALRASRLPHTPEPPGPGPLDGEVVINEIMYDPIAGPEWIELYNRGAEPVDLSGWQLVDAVAYALPAGTVLEPDDYLLVTRDPAALRASAPDAVVVGPWSGSLSNDGERVALLDACGELTDEVRYFDDGRWPIHANGGGASLELRDPRADNGVAEAWAASDEGRHAEWQHISYRGVAQPSPVGPDGRWHELVLGLLAAGEVLLDDVSVIEDPDGAALELIQDGHFETGAAVAWRLLGTHQHSEVVPDPDDPDNLVLRLVATGPTEHMHNHAETTLAGGRQITNGTTYQISYRARWVAGSDQLNTRLYFNRLARTTRLGRPAHGGTPGAPNTAYEAETAYEANIGPTFRDFGHAPAVPPPMEPITVSVRADDPDGVAAVTLWTSVEGAPFEPTPMTATDDRYEATLPGRPAGTLVQFYVEGEDDAGATATFPAAGPDSRALFQVDDGRAARNGLHNLRILMTRADADRFHTDVNLMSNDLTGGTAIYDERTVFYDVGIRGKSSQRGRPAAHRLGFFVRFGSQHPLRGVARTIALDRSEATQFGQREMLIDQVMNRAASVSAEHNDLIHIITPRPTHTGPAMLQMARFSDLMLDNQFPEGSDGMLFEYELIYYPTTTNDGTPEGLKRPQPDLVVGTNLRDLGEDPEAYRYNFLIKNNRGRDDYTGIIAFNQVFGLPDAAFRAAVDQVIDMDQWLRAFAFAGLSGAVDHYAAGAQHNVQFYVRPSDHRVLYFIHDLDFYQADPRRPLVIARDLTRLLAIPGNTRVFYGHVLDIVRTAYNPDYLAHWRDHFGALLPQQNFAAYYQWMVDRYHYVLGEVTRLFPEVPFAITTNDGDDLTVDTDTITLEGTGWLDVREIRYPDNLSPLPLTWPTGTTWTLPVRLAEGLNIIELEAFDQHGELIGADTITITRLPPAP